jgi:hypothetical protein
MATTSRPLGSTRSLDSGVGCGAVIVVYTAQKIDIEKGIFRRDWRDMSSYPWDKYNVIFS